MHQSEYKQWQTFSYQLSIKSATLPRPDLAVFILQGTGARNIEVHIHTHNWNKGQINVRWEGEPQGLQPFGITTTDQCDFINMCIAYAKDQNWI